MHGLEVRVQVQTRLNRRVEGDVVANDVRGRDAADADRARLASEISAELLAASPCI